MAKKKKDENTLQYLQMPLPQGGKYSKMTKVAFGGLNNRYTIDSGDLSMESNISTKEYPYLTPSEQRKSVLSGYGRAISMYAFDDFIIVVYYEYDVDLAEDVIKVDYIKIGRFGNTVYTGLVSSGDTYDDDVPGSVVQFNVYDTPTDPLTGQFVKKLLFFPYKASMYMNIVKTSSDPRSWEEEVLNAERKIVNAEDDETKAEAIAELYDTHLYNADLSVMYCYDDGDNKYYFTVGLAEKVEGDYGYDKDKVSYKRFVQKKYTKADCFVCDGMEVLVKEYRNDTPEVDESGAIIYPPPDTASHNCYYRNSYNNDIYRWCEYETVKREEKWGLNINDDGTYEIYGFKIENENYISDGGTTYGWKVSIPPTMPNLKYATVHLSRVFGVDDDRVYASGYNDYTNWNLDTVDEYNEANSWCSPSQANTKAGGKFTGITTFQGHVVCFKRDFMHEIYNTKNPFRLQDIYAEGAIDHRTIQDVDGKLIFVSEDDVKVYTGSNPRIIGYNLNMKNYTYAVSGTDNRNYYLYCEDDKGKMYLYVYDTVTELWSEQSIDRSVLCFAHNKNGMYMLCVDGKVYKMDTEDYDHKWSFETDLVTNKTVNIKHIKKLQMLAELNSNANIKVYILYDDEKFNENTSHLVYSSNKYGRLPIRVKPRKTANYGFKLHIEGYGYVKLYELEIFVEQGGDMYV